MNLETLTQPKALPSAPEMKALPPPRPDLLIARIEEKLGVKFIPSAEDIEQFATPPPTHAQQQRLAVFERLVTTVDLWDYQLAMNTLPKMKIPVEDDQHHGHIESYPVTPDLVAALDRAARTMYDTELQGSPLQEDADDFLSNRDIILETWLNEIDRRNEEKQKKEASPTNVGTRMVQSDNTVVFDVAEVMRNAQTIFDEAEPLKEWDEPSDYAAKYVEELKHRQL